MQSDDDALSVYSESIWRSRWQGEAREHPRKPAEYLLVKNADDFAAMLTRRGYNMRVENNYGTTFFTAMRGLSEAGYFQDTILYETIATVAEYLDKTLGNGQHHMQHECGFPLLRETKNTRDHETLAYRAACDGPTSKSVLECPQCQQYVQDDSVQEIDDAEK